MYNITVGQQPAQNNTQPDNSGTSRQPYQPTLQQITQYLESAELSNWDEVVLTATPFVLSFPFGFMAYHICRKGFGWDRSTSFFSAAFFWVALGLFFGYRAIRGRLIKDRLQAIQAAPATQAIQATNQPVAPPAPPMTAQPVQPPAQDANLERIRQIATTVTQEYNTLRDWYQQIEDRIIVDSDLAELRGALSALQTRVSELDTAIGQVPSFGAEDFQAMKDTVATLNSSMDEFSNEINNRVQQISQKVDNRQGEVADLTTKVASMQSRLQTLQQASPEGMEQNGSWVMPTIVGSGLLAGIATIVVLEKRRKTKKQKESAKRRKK